MTLPRTLPAVSRRRLLGGIGIGVGGWTLAGAASGQEEAPTPTTVAEFEPPNLPENIAVTPDGTHYLSMAPTGELWRVDPAGAVSPEAVASLPIGDQGGLLLGVTSVEDGDAVFACVNSGVEETHGVWRVPRSEDAEPMLVAGIDPAGSTLNGITGDAFDDESVLVTDHSMGAIWRVSRDGTAEVWLEDPLLEPNPYASLQVGVDGIAVGPEGAVWVDNLNFGAILRIPVTDDDTAGTPEVFLQDDRLIGADGLTVDREGALYVAVNMRNAIVRVTPEKAIEPLASGDPLDFPSDVHFGRTDDTETTLFFTNFAFPAAQAEDRQANPSYMKLDVGGPGPATGNS